MKSLTLIIDTAHPAARVIFIENDKVIASKEWENTPKVGTNLLAHIEEILKSLSRAVDDIVRIAVHVGPGSFGLVRTGIVTATILAEVASAELVGIAGEAQEELIEQCKKAVPSTFIEPRYSM